MKAIISHSEPIRLDESYYFHIQNQSDWMKAIIFTVRTNQIGDESYYYHSQHTTSEQRSYNVVYHILTSFQHPYNVVLTSCAGWEVNVQYQFQLCFSVFSIICNIYEEKCDHKQLVVFRNRLLFFCAHPRVFCFVLLDASPPRNITQTELTHDSLSFSFRSPARPNGVITKYSLYLHADGNSNLREIHFVNLHRPFEMTANRLEANTLYHAEVCIIFLRYFCNC